MRKVLLTALLFGAVAAILVNLWVALGYFPYNTQHYVEAVHRVFGYARFVAIPVALFAFLYQRNAPTKTLAWIAVMLGLPFLGTVVYLFFGLNLRQSIRFRRKQKEDASSLVAYEHTIKDTSGVDLLDKLSEQRPSTSLARQRELMERTTGAQPTSAYEYRVFHNAVDLYDVMLTDMAEAAHHIHVEYFLFEDDWLGQRVGDMLMRRAREGVECRVIYDAVGSRSTKGKFWRKLEDAGVEVSPFFEVRFRHLANRVNYRNHRKIVIIDAEIGYTGGMNVAKQYVEGVDDVEGLQAGHWRDTHLRLKGHAVSHLQLTFAQDWRFCKEIELPSAPYFKTSFEQEGIIPIQLASSGPDTPRNNIKFAYFNMITRAERYVYMTTPYFAPDESVLAAMKTAALAGVDVRLIMPRRSDSLIVSLASASFVAELLEAGVGVYHYTAGMLHSKVIVSDDVVLSIGTANMDARSHDLNFENNVVLYDTALAKQERAALDQDMEQRCTKLTHDNWPNPHLHIRLARGAARVFSPLL